MDKWAFYVRNKAGVFRHGMCAIVRVNSENAQPTRNIYMYILCLSVCTTVWKSLSIILCTKIKRLSAINVKIYNIIFPHMSEKRVLSENDMAACMYKADTCYYAISFWS